MFSHARLAIFNLIRSRSPSVAFCAPSDLVGQHVAVLGQYDGRDIAKLEAILRKELPNSHKQTMLDVGANVGTHTIGLSHLFARVIAFEPHPAVSLVATANVIAAGLRNVEVRGIGLSDAGGTAKLSVTAGAFSWSGLGRNDWPTIEVGVDSGDNAVAHECSIGFVKIDVEGHEAAVLRGLHKTVVRCSPVIAFEALDSHVADQCVSFLRSLNYRRFIGLGRIKPKISKLLFGNRPEPLRETRRYYSIVALPR